MHALLQVTECLANAKRPPLVRWLARVEAVRTGMGARCITSHVPGHEWALLFAAGLSPEDAVLARLMRVAD